MNTSRLIRNQLIIFTIIAVVATAFTGIYYLRIPAALGIGRYRVVVDLPKAGGLYHDANVTYDGHTIGRVESVDLTPAGVTATLSLIDSAPVPADLIARVRSMSAIGEQYVDLQPRVSHGPYLHDGSTITVDQVRIADEIGPILDQTRKILASLPPDTLHTVLDQMARGLGGAGKDLATLLDSTTTFVDGLAANADALTTLVRQLTPLLNTQVVSSAEIRAWAANIADLSGQLSTADPALRGILQRGPAAADTADQLFQKLAPTLPVLLANLVTTGHIAVTYNPAVEQILVLLPPLIAAENASGKRGAPDAAANVLFALELQDPAGCTTGYLPPSQRRSPTATDSPDTPNNLYCNVAHNSPFAVRGMHNLPCLNNPGVRAASPDQCVNGAIPPSGDNNPSEVDPGPTPAAAPPPPDHPGPAPGAAPASAPANNPPPAAVAHYLPGSSDTYLTPDGNAYRHIDIDQPPNPAPSQDPAWTSLLTAPLP
jgi:phospholipid/cholesterol/gamma-HCH transport system substrate-binding protein